MPPASTMEDLRPGEHRLLTAHLQDWLGLWPPARAAPNTTGGLSIIGSERRLRPAWDGRLYPAIAVESLAGTVLSVTPDHVESVRAAAGGSLRDVVELLPALVGFADRRFGDGVFRFSLDIAAESELADAGAWFDPEDRRVPEWLTPYNGEVLVALDAEGRYEGGVGIKAHTRYGEELAVQTEPHARGRGLARRLVAQAARAIIERGAIPHYNHADDNRASAAVATAVGFADRGWRIWELR